MEASAKEAGNQELIQAVKFLLDLSNIARKEGLLALEDATYNKLPVPYGSYLYSMIRTIVDGTAPRHATTSGRRAISQATGRCCTTSCLP